MVARVLDEDGEEAAIFGGMRSTSAACSAAKLLRANHRSFTSFNGGLPGSQWFIDNSGATKLSEGLAVNTVLTALNLGWNTVGDAGVTSLSEALAVNTVLTELSLGESRLGDAGATSLSEALAVNTVLKGLSFGESRLGDAGATSLSEALAVNTALTELSFGESRLGDAGATYLSEALSVNTVLSELTLGANEIGHVGTLALGKALSARPLYTTARFKLGGSVRLSECWEALEFPMAGRSWSNEEVLTFFVELQARLAIALP